MAHIDGTTGNDVLYGTPDRDIIHPGAGNDTVFAGGGNDSVDDHTPLSPHPSIGSGGDDTAFNGGPGNDTLNAGLGNDRLNGGSGNDTLIGEARADPAGNDLLFGDADNDTLFGFAGDDTLSGGRGSDTLSGGVGNDILDFNFVSHSAPDNRDTVEDVDGIGTPGGDVFDVSTIDAFTTAPDNQDFLFIGTGPFSAGAAGELRVADAGGGNTVIQGNVDGGLVDLEILVQDGGIDPSQYTEGDFIL